MRPFFSLRSIARTSVLAVFPVLSGVVLSGCPGGASLDGPDQFLNVSGDTCDALPIFARSCGSSACHASADGTTPPSGGVDLVTPGVAERLFDIDATYPGVSGCSDVPEKLVDSTNVDASLMLTKLDGTQKCGAAMPIGQPLTTTDLQCVRLWIEGVAAAGAVGPDQGTGGASQAGDPTATGGAQ